MASDPATTAVIDGVILSAALFVLTCFAIRYSWIHVLHVQIPEYRDYLGIRPVESPTELRGKQNSEPKKAANPGDQSDLISEHLKVEVMPVEAGPPVLSSDLTNATSVAPPDQPVNVATEIALQLPLESYCGTYKSPSQRMTIKIAVKNDQLSMHITGELPLALSRVSEAEFAIAGANNGRIEFLPAQNGEIVRLRLSRDGQQVTAERQ
jgi:hypothetical protein